MPFESNSFSFFDFCRHPCLNSSQLIQGSVGHFATVRKLDAEHALADGLAQIRKVLCCVCHGAILSREPAFAILGEPGFALLAPALFRFR